MEGKKYYTLIKNNHPVFGNNTFVRGVIMGIMCTTCGEDPIGPQLVEKGTDNHIYQVTTTLTKYQLFVGRVEKKYPGLCEFNADMDRDLI